MIYEIREYVAMPGRMPDLVRRFTEHTLAGFDRHAMPCAFIGNTEIGDNSTHEIVYALRFDSIAEMTEKWQAFLADPAWVAAKAASEADGPLVERIRRRVLNADAYTPA